MSEEVVGVQTVFAFEWNHCTYESGFSIVSLHQTKAGAWMAMRRELVAWAMKKRDDSLLVGFDFTSKHNQAWRVRVYEVKP